MHTDFAATLVAIAIAALATAPAAQTPAAPSPSSAGAGSAQTGSAQTGSAPNGKDLYQKYSCYACHGYDGHGGAGARLVPLAMALPRFTAYVRNPRQMPPYTTQVLSDAQLADLWTYIRSLPESPAAKTIPLLTRIMGEK